jgi:hypothetical protein
MNASSSLSAAIAATPCQQPSFLEQLDRRWEEFMLSYNSLSGKDKMFRCAQPDIACCSSSLSIHIPIRSISILTVSSFCYLFQFLSGTLESRYKAGTPEAKLGARLRAVEGALSTFRMGFRVLSYHTQWRSFRVEWQKFVQASLINICS